MRAACIVGLAGAPGFVSRPARADNATTKAQCIDANTHGQDLRRDGKVSAARAQFRTCAVPACPAMLRDDCTRRLDELDKVQPTVVFLAKDASGKDVSAVKVTVDGAPLADRLDGTDLPVDPGEHVFTFTAAGQPPVTVTLVLAAGEKDRREHVLLGGAAAPARGTVGAPGDIHRAHLAIATSAGATVSVDGQPVGTGAFDGPEPAGPHELVVTEPGKLPYKAQLDLRDGETRTLTVTLESEKHGASPWPWILGGAVVAAGAVVGGYFLFKPKDETNGVPAGSFAPTVNFSSFLSGGR